MLDKTFLAFLLTLAAAGTLADPAAPAHAAAAAPYAGQQGRAVKAYSDQEVAALLQGQGQGFAKPAELNGYPGPAHVLELAQPLGLTPVQREATGRLMAEHQARARRLGAALVEAERALDDAFARRSVDEAELQRLTGESARRLAELRAEHLRTHLAQTALLDAAQIRRYQELRGYAAGAGGGGHHH